MRVGCRTGQRFCTRVQAVRGVRGVQQTQTYLLSISIRFTPAPWPEGCSTATVDKSSPSRIAPRMQVKFCLISKTRQSHLHIKIQCSIYIEEMAISHPCQAKARDENSAAAIRTLHMPHRSYIIGKHTFVPFRLLNDGFARYREYSLQLGCVPCGKPAQGSVAQVMATQAACPVPSYPGPKSVRHTEWQVDERVTRALETPLSFSARRESKKGRQATPPGTVHFPLRLTANHLPWPTARQGFPTTHI